MNVMLLESPAFQPLSILRKSILLKISGIGAEYLYAIQHPINCSALILACSCARSGTGDCATALAVVRTMSFTGSVTSGVAIVHATVIATSTC